MFHICLSIITWDNNNEEQTWLKKDCMRSISTGKMIFYPYFYWEYGHRETQTVISSIPVYVSLRCTLALFKYFSIINLKILFFCTFALYELSRIVQFPVFLILILMHFSKILSKYTTLKVGSITLLLSCSGFVSLYLFSHFNWTWHHKVAIFAQIKNWSAEISSQSFHNN